LRRSSAAEMPCFDAVTSKMARNQSASAFLLCSKIVPAITDTWRRQPMHS
jgi:hypothetical protein